MTTQYHSIIPDDADGAPHCQQHTIRMERRRTFTADGVSMDVYVCPFDEGHVEFRPHKEDGDAAMVAA